jgi:hypothetical protein
VWWPARRQAFAFEAYSADLPDGQHVGTLDAGGVALFTGLPAGSCDVRFPRVFEDIEAIRDGTQESRSR